MTRATTTKTTPAPLALDDQALLATWFDSTDPITEISRQHNISLRQIAAWAKRPDIAETITTLRELHEERAKLQLTLAAYDAIVTLKFITMTDRPNNTNEIARRAAEGILRRCTFLDPKATKSPASSAATTPPTINPNAAVKDPVAAPPPEPRATCAPHASHQPNVPIAPPPPRSGEGQKPGDSGEVAPPRSTIKPPAPRIDADEHHRHGPAHLPPPHQSASHSPAARTQPRSPPQSPPTPRVG